MKIKGYEIKRTEKAIQVRAGYPRQGGKDKVWMPLSQITIEPSFVDIANEKRQDGIIIDAPDWLLNKIEEEADTVFLAIA